MRYLYQIWSELGSKHAGDKYVTTTKFEMETGRHMYMYVENCFANENGIVHKPRWRFELSGCFLKLVLQNKYFKYIKNIFY